MGSFWKKAGRVATAIYTGGVSEYANMLDGSDRRGRRASAYEQQRAAITDPTTGEFVFDEQGYTNTMPGRYVAREAQYASERFIAAKNARLRADAIADLRGGLGLLESYRPGGAAAIASPYFSQLANVRLASQQEAPDLLAEVRRAAQQKANEKARQAQYMQIAGAALTAVGGIFGGPAGAAAGAAVAGIGNATIGADAAQAQQNAASMEPGINTLGGGVPYGGTTGPAAAPPAQAYGAPQPGVQASPDLMPEGGNPQFAQPPGPGGGFRAQGAGAGAGGLLQQPGAGPAVAGGQKRLANQQAGPGARAPGMAARGGGQPAGSGGAAGQGAPRGGFLAQIVSLDAAARLNGPDWWGRQLASLDELEIEVEAIRYA